MITELYQQSVFKRCHSDKHLSEVLTTRWRQKSTNIDMEQNYVTVALCRRIARSVRLPVHPSACPVAQLPRL